MEEQILTREGRLTKWFQANPEVWRDLQEEFDECMSNSTEIGLSVNCENREFYAGECSGLKIAKTINEKYRK